MSEEGTGEPEPKRTKQASPIVALNVGGQVFTTTKSTLLNTPSPYFKRLMEEGDGPEMAGALRDDQGRLFIDRDPNLFKYILEYLRFNFEAGHLTDQEREKLKREALYYQLDGLYDLLRPPSTGYDHTFLSEEDRVIRLRAQEARESLMKGEGGQKMDDELLINIFPNNGGQQESRLPTMFDKPQTSPEATILFDAIVNRARSATTEVPISAEEFKQRLVRFGGPYMANFPLENCVIAGGSVLTCLQSNAFSPDTSGDIDVFVVADNPEAGKVAFNRILTHLSTRRAQIGHNQLLVTRSPFAVTFCVGAPQRHIQLILTCYQCVSEILLNFDIDCCQVAWDGRRVLATPSAFRALQTGINIADPARRGGSDEYEWRLAKYADRGFLVAVPGLDVSKIKEEYVRNSCFVYEDRCLKRVRLTFTKDEQFPQYEIEEHGVKGLAKLIVLSTIYCFCGDVERGINEPTERRLQDGERRWPGSFLGSLGTGNYLLLLGKLRLGLSTWLQETPPHPPPHFLQADASYVRFVDTAGVDLMPWREEPRRAFELLSGAGDLETDTAVVDDTHQKRLVCYDFIANVDASPDTPNVLDAKRQFPSYPFVVGRGRLRRHLEFLLSTQKNANPWYREGDALEEWTRGTYA